jgi:hypothetical protein
LGRVTQTAQDILTQMSSSSALYNVENTVVNLKELKQNFAQGLSQRFQNIHAFVRATSQAQQQQMQQQLANTIDQVLTSSDNTLSNINPPITDKNDRSSFIITPKSTAHHTNSQFPQQQQQQQPPNGAFN